MEYILDTAKMKVGDIILQSGTSKFSWWIKKGTKSDYSHALLYIGNSAIHALTSGVYSTNPQRIIVDNPKNIKILRFKEPLSEKSINILVTYARNLSGSLYNKAEAIISPVFNKSKKNATSSGQYCSRLVAQAYLQAGITIVKNSDYCTPEDINKSESLIEVKECLKEATTQDIDFVKTDDPILENQKRTFIWLNKSRELFKEQNINIQTIGDVDQGLMSVPELDTEVCKHMLSSKYLEHYSFDKEVNPYRYDLDLFLERSRNARDEELEIFFGELNKEPNMIVRHSTSYFNSGLNYSHLGLDYHRLNVKLYKNLLLLSRERIEVLKQFSILLHQPKLVEISSYLARSIDKII